VYVAPLAASVSTALRQRVNPSKTVFLRVINALELALAARP
jgi:hypothetical protein